MAAQGNTFPLIIRLETVTEKGVQEGRSLQVRDDWQQHLNRSHLIDSRGRATINALDPTLCLCLVGAHVNHAACDVLHMVCNSLLFCPGTLLLSDAVTLIDCL